MSHQNNRYIIHLPTAHPRQFAIMVCIIAIALLVPLFELNVVQSAQAAGLTYNRAAAVAAGRANNYNDSKKHSDSNGPRECTGFVNYVLWHGGITTVPNADSTNRWFGNHQIVQWMENNPSAWTFLPLSQLQIGDIVLFSPDVIDTQSWKNSDHLFGWWHSSIVVSSNGYIGEWNHEELDISPYWVTTLYGSDNLPRTVQTRMGIHINDTPFRAPVVTSPTNGQTLTSRAFTVTVTPGTDNYTGAHDFNLIVADNPQFSNPVYNNSNGWSRSTSMPVTVTHDGTWYLELRQGDTVSTSGDWIKVTFTVNKSTPPGMTTIVSPTSNATIIGPKVTFQFKLGQPNYTGRIDSLLQVYPEGNTSKAVASAGGIVGTSYALTLSPGKYMANVTSSDTAGTMGPQSPFVHFTVVGPPPPGTSTIVQPANGTTVTGPNVSFKFNVGTPNYTGFVDDYLMVFSEGNQTTPVFAQTGIIGNSFATTLPPGAYMAMVRSGDGAGTIGAWSPLVHFVVAKPITVVCGTQTMPALSYGGTTTATSTCKVSIFPFNVPASKAGATLLDIQSDFSVNYQYSLVLKNASGVVIAQAHSSTISSRGIIQANLSAGNYTLETTPISSFQRDLRVSLYTMYATIPFDSGSTWGTAQVYNSDVAYARMWGWATTANVWHVYVSKLAGNLDMTVCIYRENNSLIKCGATVNGFLDLVVSGDSFGSPSAYSYRFVTFQPKAGTSGTFKTTWSSTIHQPLPTVAPAASAASVTASATPASTPVPTKAPSLLGVLVPNTPVPTPPPAVLGGHD